MRNEAARSLQQEGQMVGTALVFVGDYRSGVPFQVGSRIQQTTVNQILGGQNGDQQQAVVDDPTDYNGYIYNYTQCGPGNYNILFVRDQTLQQDQTYTFGTDATFFSTEAQLLEVDLQSGAAPAPEEENVTEPENVTDAENVTAPENVTDADNDTVEVTNVTVGNETAGNETS